MSRRRSGCFGPSRYLVSGVLIGSSFEIPWGARKNETVISNILQRKLAFTNRISTALAQALPYSFFFLRLRLIGLLRPRAVSASKRAPRRASSRDGPAQTWKQICLALLLLRPLRWLRQRGARHSLSSLQGKPVPLPDPTTLGSGSTLPQQPQHHNHEAHHRKKNCRGRARQGRRSQLRIFQQPTKKKNLVLLSTKGRQG